MGLEDKPFLFFNGSFLGDIRWFLGVPFGPQLQRWRALHGFHHEVGISPAWRAMNVPLLLELPWLHQPEIKTGEKEGGHFVLNMGYGQRIVMKDEDDDDDDDGDDDDDDGHGDSGDSDGDTDGGGDGGSPIPRLSWHQCAYSN